MTTSMKFWLVVGGLVFARWAYKRFMRWRYERLLMSKTDLQARVRFLENQVKIYETASDRMLNNLGDVINNVGNNTHIAETNSEIIAKAGQALITISRMPQGVDYSNAKMQHLINEIERVLLYASNGRTNMISDNAFRFLSSFSTSSLKVLMDSGTVINLTFK